MTARAGFDITDALDGAAYFCPRNRAGFAQLSGGSADTTPPDLTVISPSAGVQPGDPGGFPRDFYTAKSTPIVMQVTDNAGAVAVRYIAITATFTYADGSKLVEPVYRRGNFVGLYAARSYQVAIAGGVELHCSRDGGWPGTTGVMPMEFDVDALDGAGNLS